MLVVMAALSDYLQQAVLNQSLRGLTYPAPAATVYVALFLSDPGTSDSPAGELTSGSSPGYARAAVSTSGSFNAPTVSGSARTTHNLVTISFPQATGAWQGPVLFFAIFDAATAGHMLYHGATASPLTTLSGYQQQFAAGALVINIS